MGKSSVNDVAPRLRVTGKGHLLMEFVQPAKKRKKEEKKKEKKKKKKAKKKKKKDVVEGLGS